MKNFNLAEAKAGHPVQTRSGRSVRIICFDRKGTIYNIVALMCVRTDLPEKIVYYTSSGRYFDDTEESEYDLVMV